jgi:hypothetical protein
MRSALVPRRAGVMPVLDANMGTRAKPCNGVANCFCGWPIPAEVDKVDRVKSGNPGIFASPLFE